MRRGPAAQWSSVNPTLAQGEIGLETDTGKLKIGDGATPWTALRYGPEVDPGQLPASTVSAVGAPGGSVPVADGSGGFNWESRKIPFREPKTWSIPGEVSVGTLPGPEIAPAAGEQVLAVRVGYRLRQGTAVKFSIDRNGSPMTGFSNLEATSTPQHAAPTAVALSEADELTLVISQVTGAPVGLSVTLQLEHDAS